jgi:hypothetical protein
VIGKLKGLLDAVGEDWAIVDGGGVGYRVSCSAKTLAALPGRAEPVALFTEMLVSENAARPSGPDAADALAVAICHAHHRGRAAIAGALRTG